MSILQEILEKEGIRAEEIRWDLTPRIAMGEPISVTSQEELERYLNYRKTIVGYFFYINVWNTYAYLCLAYNSESKIKTVYCFEDELEEYIPYDMLINAIEEHGGAINISGWYPINDTIKEKLQIALTNNLSQK